MLGAPDKLALKLSAARRNYSFCRSKYIMRLACVASAAFILVTTGFGTVALAAPQLVVYPERYPSTELDVWSSSSLGIKIANLDGKIVVDKVYKHAEASNLLKVKDVLSAIAGVRLSWDNHDEFYRIMDGTPPSEKVRIEIIRDGQRRECLVPTFRSNLDDIPIIVELLKDSSVITNHLQDTNREAFLDDLSSRMVSAVDESESPREAAEAINALVDEIGVSHTALMSSQSWRQLLGVRTGDLGLILQRHVIDGDNRYFVYDRKPGSSGGQSELLLGDEVVAINDVPLEDSRRLILSGVEHRHRLFILQVAVGEKVTVDFRRNKNGDPRRVSLDAREAVPSVDVIELSSRVIVSGDNRHGYLRFWDMMPGGSAARMNKVLKEKLLECDSIILDLRGRGGLPSEVVDLVKAVEEINMPVIAITDAATRSAKEMLTFLLKKQSHVIVVGQRTAGALVGMNLTPLPSGSGFMFPAASAKQMMVFTDNVILEQVGVEPDIQLEFKLPWCGGNDDLVQGAVEIGDKTIGPAAQPREKMGQGVPG